MAQAFVSTRIVTPDGEFRGAILVDDGRITAMLSREEISSQYLLRDFGSLVILPGMVDSHVHINEPGRTEWEGFFTATRAAAAGGFTTLVDMPLNCLPETTTVAALQQKRTAARGQCFVDWAPWGGVAGDNAEHVEPLAVAGVRGFKCFLVYPGCDGFQMVSAAQLETALPHISRTGLPLLVHAELQPPIDVATASLADEDWRRYDTYLRSRPDEAELSAIRYLLDLCRQYRFPLHIVHLSSALALNELRMARQQQLPFTVETCPHYLHFAAEDIADGSTVHKCAPPIRSRQNREALWHALQEGLIDLVATDHSPCPPEMKDLEHGRFDHAWGGIAGLQLAVSVVWTGMRERSMTLTDLARLMSQKPAELAGLQSRKGAIRAGADADFVIFDPEAAFTVNTESLYQRHKLTPYMGAHLRGKVIATFLRGRPVYQEGTVVELPLGREVELRGNQLSAAHVVR